MYYIVEYYSDLEWTDTCNHIDVSHKVREVRRERVDIQTHICTHTQFHVQEILELGKIISSDVEYTVGHMGED